MLTRFHTATVASIIAAFTLAGCGSAPSPAPSATGPTISATASPATPSTSPSSRTVAIGSLTLDATGCHWAGDTSGLPAGSIRIEVTNATPDDAAIPLFVVGPGHTYAELAAYLQAEDALAHQDPHSAIKINPDVATGFGIIGLLRSGKKASLMANDIPSGSVAGLACVDADPAKGITYDVYSVGPLEFR